MEKRGGKRRIGRCTKRGLSNVIRTVRLFFEMQLVLILMSKGNLAANFFLHSF